jgi:hypothetical protein
MSETRRYQPTTVEVNLRNWLVAALDGFPTVEVIYQNQGSVRVPRPFVTLQVLTDIQIQDPEQIVRDVQLPDGSYQVDTLERRQGSVQVIAHGSESWNIMRAVSRSLRRQTVLEVNRANGVEVLEELSGILDLPELMSTTTEPRRSQDYSFSYCELTTEVTGAGVLERAITSGDVYQDTPGDGVDPVADVSWPSTP